MVAGSENEDDVRRSVVLSGELDLAITLLKEGLAHLQAISAANDVFHVPILLLAAGLERLLKVVICYRVIKDEGRYPRPEEIEHTHNIEALLDQVLALIPEEEFAAPAAKEDLHYLREDSHFRRLLGILADFGRGPVRYWNLEVVKGREPRSMSPQEAWERFEGDIAQELGMLTREALVPGVRDVIEKVNERIVANVERALRALCRLFTLGPLGLEAKRQSGLIGDFLFLTDEQLGSTRYGPR